MQAGTSVFIPVKDVMMVVILKVAVTVVTFGDAEFSTDTSQYKV